MPPRPPDNPPNRPGRPSHAAAHRHAGARPAPRPPGRAAAQQGGPAGAANWLYGTHPVLAALANPHRRLRRLLLTEEAEAGLAGRLPAAMPLAAERSDRQRLDALLGRDAVHQGVALLADPLAAPPLDQVLQRPGPLLMLDQVTDPQQCRRHPPHRRGLRRRRRHRAGPPRARPHRGAGQSRRRSHSTPSPTPARRQPGPRPGTRWRRPDAGAPWGSTARRRQPRRHTRSRRLEDGAGAGRRGRGPAPPRPGAAATRSPAHPDARSAIESLNVSATPPRWRIYELTRGG